MLVVRSVQSGFRVINLVKFKAKSCRNINFIWNVINNNRNFQIYNKKLSQKNSIFTMMKKSNELVLHNIAFLFVAKLQLIIKSLNEFFGFACIKCGKKILQSP